MDRDFRLSRAAMAAIVLLRVAIGWHFLYEGVAKLSKPSWSAAGYLQQSKGVLAELFKWMAGSPSVLEWVNPLNMWGLTLIIYDLVLLDIRMPKLDGISALKKIKTVSPETIVIMITAFASTDKAIKAMKEGAYDYISKPFKVDEIKLIIKNALEKKNLQKENIPLKQVVRSRYHFDNIIGQSPNMLALYDLLEKVAPTKTNILITGDS